MSETNELEALARRAVACPGWRWMPGMLATCRDCLFRVTSTDPRWAGSADGVFGRAGITSSVCIGEYLPVFSDAATLGCLLALVREASGDPLAHTYPLAAGGWACWFGCVDRSGATEAEAMIAVLETIAEHAALVAALEAAPEVKP